MGIRINGNTKQLREPTYCKDTDFCRISTLTRSDEYESEDDHDDDGEVAEDGGGDLVDGGLLEVEEAKGQSEAREDGQVDVIDVRLADACPAASDCGEGLGHGDGVDGQVSKEVEGQHKVEEALHPRPEEQLRHGPKLEPLQDVEAPLVARRHVPPAPG